MTGQSTKTTRPFTRKFQSAALAIISMSALSLSPAQAADNAGATTGNGINKVLVQIGNDSITVSELEKTLASSPFAVQFNTMSQDSQASLRGVILKRLVGAHLLKAEANAHKLADSKDFREDVASFRKSLLYRRYMDQLRKSVKIPRENLGQLMKEFKDNPDALAAARSTNVTDRYRTLRALAIQHMRETYSVITFEERIKPGISPDTILLQGNNIGITYGDLIRGHNLAGEPSAAWIKERLYQQAEVELVAEEAKAHNIDVSRQVESYRQERLPALLRTNMEKSWLKDKNTLRNYYDAHKEIGTVSARFRIGQIVLSDRKVAKRLHKAIANGASLFKMAASYSIDPYGKSHNGDMGWLKQGSASAKIDKAINSLKKGELSKVIKTARGFHIVQMLDRRDEEQMDFASIRDKVKQAFIDMKMAAYLKQLQKKHKIVWKLLEQPKQPAGNMTKSNRI